MKFTEPKPTVVGHTVYWDVMGPKIVHPLSCTIAVPHACECPHWRALDRHDIHTDAPIERGTMYLGVLVADRLHLFNDNDGDQRRWIAQVHDEFDVIEDAFRAETERKMSRV